MIFDQFAGKNRVEIRFVCVHLWLKPISTHFLKKCLETSSFITNYAPSALSGACFDVTPALTLRFGDDAAGKRRRRKSSMLVQRMFKVECSKILGKITC
jgi:hypothetical protein